MIRIDVKWKSEPFRLTASGHADGPRNEKDHDLVCCAVSALVQTLGVSCASLTDVNTLYRDSKGDAEIVVTDTEAHWDELVPRFQMALDGLQVLAAQYPEYITLTVCE